MVVMPSGNCDMRVHSYGFNSIEVYFPFVEDECVVDLAFVICSE